MTFTRARARPCAVAVTVLAMVAGAPRIAASGPDQMPPATPAANVLRARTYKPMVQRFAISPGLLPVAAWKMLRSPQAAAAARAGTDYQRRCAAGDPSLAVRIDGVREPVAPGAVVQIAGDCFGSTPGSVTLTGMQSATVRLTVQSWSNTAIAALVPSVPGARHQSAVLVVTRASAGAKHGADRASGPLRGAPAAAGVQSAEGSSQPSAGGAQTPPLSAKPTVPDHGIVYATGSNAPASLPTNQASVEFWPELEYRTVGAEAIVNRTCAFPRCLNAGDDAPAPVAFGYACPAPCADHEAQGRASGVNGNGLHWLHEADDVWVVRHPAGWQVQQVNVLGRDGSLSIPPPQEASPERTLLTFHWQDEHATYQDQESGPWFFSKYWFTVTVVGAKGTWQS